MTSAPRLGLLGGTFDPIHYGHLDAAAAARTALALEHVWFVPSHVPVHRGRHPEVTPFHRFALTVLATAGENAYRASDLELCRTGSTYTMDTLLALHSRGWQPSQLYFILGTDAFAEIATWHAYPDVIDAAHFVVIARPGTTVGEAAARAPELRPRFRHAGSLDGPGTGIVLVEAQTRDVSSTMIRERLHKGQAIDDLVPTAVARHIVAHQLYGSVDRLHG